MENVLDIYTRPYDSKYPQVCMDEASKQLIRETRQPLPAQPGHPERYDYEYQRDGVCNLFMLFEPLQGRRHVRVTDQRTRQDWAHFMKDVVDVHYPDAERITVVLDNLNTHTLAALYETFEPPEARRIASKLDLQYTPKHGSWLNMAEIELSVLNRQCLDRRIADKAILEQEVIAWAIERNLQAASVEWRFTTANARIKLKRLYPVITP